MLAIHISKIDPNVVRKKFLIHQCAEPVRQETKQKSFVVPINALIPGRANKSRKEMMKAISYAYDPQTPPPKRTKLF